MRGFFAEFILSGQSEILRCAQDDSEGLRMTDGGLFFYERRTTRIREPDMSPLLSLSCYPQSGGHERNRFE